MQFDMHIIVLHAKCEYGSSLGVLSLDVRRARGRVCDISSLLLRARASYPDLANIIKMLIPLHFAFNDFIHNDSR